MMSSGPHPSVPLTQAQIAQQQQAQAHASELAKRRSRKPTDKNIPGGVEDCIIDPDGVKRYVELREIERLIDATITRKRLDVLDDAKRSSKVAICPALHCLLPLLCSLTDNILSCEKRCESGLATLPKTRFGREKVSMQTLLTLLRLWRHLTA
jgi:hypothetical protein